MGPPEVGFDVKCELKPTITTMLALIFEHVLIQLKSNNFPPPPQIDLKDAKTFIQSNNIEEGKRVTHVSHTAQWTHFQQN